MQTEFSVYVLLRLWLYLKFHQGWEGNPQDAVLKSHKYFQVSHQVQFELEVMSEVFEKIFWHNLHIWIVLGMLLAFSSFLDQFQDRVKTKTKRFFLDTRDGQPYVEVFKSLRLNHLVNHHMDMEMLLTDRIIPRQVRVFLAVCPSNGSISRAKMSPWFQNPTVRLISHFLASSAFYYRYVLLVFCSGCTQFTRTSGGCCCGRTRVSTKDPRHWRKFSSTSLVWGAVGPFT